MLQEQIQSYIICRTWWGCRFFKNPVFKDYRWCMPHNIQHLLNSISFWLIFTSWHIHFIYSRLSLQSGITEHSNTCIPNWYEIIYKEDIVSRRAINFDQLMNRMIISLTVSNRCKSLFVKLILYDLYCSNTQRVIWGFKFYTIKCYENLPCFHICLARHFL